jgi:hypothetical protein
VSRLLASPRRRRRLVRWGLVAAVVLSAVLVGVLWPNTGRMHSRFSGAKAQVPVEPPPSVPLARGARHAAENVVSQFVSTAILRHHAERSWAITSRELHDGFTRRDYENGVMPVAPFPAKDYCGGKMKPTYSHGNVADYRVVLYGCPGSDVQEQMYETEVRRVGPPSHARWLVSYWMPEGGGISTPTRNRREAPEDSRPSLALSWIFLPLGILSLIVIVPATLAVRNWLVTRRAERQYATARPLPPLDAS